MNFPEGIKYTEEHEWVSLDGDVATIGITDFAQSELGDIVFVEVETVGESLAKNEVFGTVEAVKTVSDLYLPLSGEVLEVNARLTDEPELINNDPFGEGWIIKLKVDNVADAEELMDAGAYKESVGH
ncbi:Glycine cleavage system H protein [compost metagenome]